MPKFRDLSQRQQNRHLLLQKQKENLVINNTPHSTYRERLSADIRNTIKLPPNISNTTHIQLEDLLEEIEKTDEPEQSIVTQEVDHDCTKHRIIQNECHAYCGYTIQKTLEELERKINLIINLIQNSDIHETTVINNERSLLSKFPLSTIDDLLKFEQELQSDKQIRKQFRNNITKIRGKTYAHRIRNILRATLTDDLCKKLSWTGHKGSMPIKDLGFVYVITDYVSTMDQVSRNDVSKIVQEWMRHAGDRTSYQEKRKTTQSAMNYRRKLEGS